VIKVWYVDPFFYALYGNFSSGQHWHFCLAIGPTMIGIALSNLLKDLYSLILVHQRVVSLPPVT